MVFVCCIQISEILLALSITLLLSIGIAMIVVLGRPNIRTNHGYIKSRPNHTFCPGLYKWDAFSCKDAYTNIICRCPIYNRTGK